MLNNTLLQKITNKVPIVKISGTIADARKYIEENISDIETMNYIYAIDDKRKLFGVFSIKEIFRLPPGTKIKDICKTTPLVTALVTTYKDEIAYKALQHNIKAIPIVDENKTFLGVIPSNAILSILHKKLHGDILHFAGIHRSHAEFDNIFEIPLLKAIWHRLPWLLIGLIGGIVAAKIIGGFENTLEQNIILATYIPLVVYIADAVGTQLEAFTIRDLAIFRKLDATKYFLKQFIIVFIIAILLGIILTTAQLLINGNIKMAIVLGTAIVAASLSSIFTGIMVPLIFRKFRFDPADASDPIGTIIQDILSVLIYFTIASAIL